MATTVADLVARLRADTTQFNSAMTRAQTTTTSSTSKMASAFGAMAKSMGLAFAVYGITRFVGSAIREAEEAQKVARQTAAVLQSTGNAANVTAKHIDRLSDKLALLAGVDDEAVGAMNNWLLTFKGIQNVGADKIFDRTAKAAVNLAAAMGAKGGGGTEGSLSSAATMLGKALNDPIRGLTALTRAGIQFTDQQKDQIRWLTATGQTLEAQKIILAEVEAQVAGSAAAQASATDRLKVAWGQLQETVGALVIPVLERLVPIFQSVLNWVQSNKAGIESFFRGVGAVATEVGNVIMFVVNNVIVPAFNVMKFVFQSVATAISAVWTGFLRPTFQAVSFVVGALKSAFVAGFNGIKSVVTSVGKVIKDILKGIKSAIDAVIDSLSMLGGAASGAGGAADKVQVPKKRQFGGPVAPQRPYIVGEAGPELFVPRVGGQIIPNNRLARAGGGLTVNVYVSGSVLSERQLVDVITEAQRRNTRQGR